MVFSVGSGSGRGILQHYEAGTGGKNHERSRAGDRRTHCPHIAWLGPGKVRLWQRKQQEGAWIRPELKTCMGVSVGGHLSKAAGSASQRCGVRVYSWFKSSPAEIWGWAAKAAFLRNRAESPEEMRPIQDPHSSTHWQVLS